MKISSLVIERLDEIETIAFVFNIPGDVSLTHGDVMNACNNCSYLQDTVKNVEIHRNVLIVHPTPGTLAETSILEFIGYCLNTANITVGNLFVMT